MNKIKNRRHKPFYKQFLKLRKNIQDRPKIFNFKKEKWKRLQFYSKKQLKFFRRFKISDQHQLTISKFVSRGNSFQKKFKTNLLERKTFNLFYGGLRKNYFKKKIKIIKKTNSRKQLLNFLESRLDIILYRANFALSIKNARQLILHGHVLVNELPVKICSYTVETNDLIKIVQEKKSYELIKKNIDRSNFWPIPPKHLVVNYRTLEIIFFNESTPIFNHYLNFNSVITNINKY